MSTLCIKPSGLPEVKNKPWSLVIRTHDLVGTEYDILCYLTDDAAQAVIEAGAPYWLFGKPDWDDRHRLRELERARVLKETARLIEEKHKDE